MWCRIESEKSRPPERLSRIAPNSPAARKRAAGRWRRAPFVGHAIGEILLIGIARKILQWQHGQGINLLEAGREAGRAMRPPAKQWPRLPASRQLPR
jgi:hypothetical protein